MEKNHKNSPSTSSSNNKIENNNNNNTNNNNNDNNNNSNIDSINNNNNKNKHIKALSLSSTSSELSPLSSPDINPISPQINNTRSPPPDSPLSSDLSHVSPSPEKNKPQPNNHRSPPVESPIRSVPNHVPPVAPRNALPVKGSGAGRQVRQAVSVLRRERKEKTVKKAALGFRVCGLVFCMVSLAVMATDKNRGWALDSFYRYKEFRYCISVNVAGFLYSVVQTCDLAFTMCTGKHVLRHKYRFYFDFAMDQILTYLLMSASSSAATRVDDWQSNWGKDEFPMIASISVGLSFMSFASLAASTLVSGYALCTWSSF